MKLMRPLLAVVLIAALPVAVQAKDDVKKVRGAAAKRAAIDAEAAEVLKTVLAESPDAQALEDRAWGWAAFHNTKVAVGISGGGGHGVAVAKAGKRTYMRMGTGGIGFGLGAQKYKALFFFETEERFKEFVDGGWQGAAGASAAAGTEGANAAATFHQGVAVFVVTDKGLMANADVTGTKYWQNKKLNR